MRRSWFLWVPAAHTLKLIKLGCQENIDFAGENAHAAPHRKNLGADPYGYQLWVAVRILHRLHGIFRCESAHHQSELAVGCRLDGKAVNPQHILRSVSTAAVDFHKELDVFHDSFLFLSRRTFDIAKIQSMCQRHDSDYSQNNRKGDSFQMANLVKRN